MCHPLTSLHTLISVQLNNSNLSAGPGFPFPEKDYKEAMRLIAQSESDVLQSVLSAGSPASAAAVVQTYQVACTSLADRVSGYRCRDTAVKKKNKDEGCRKCQVIEESLLGVLHYLQYHFPSLFNKSQPVPVSVWNTVKASFLEREVRIEKALERLALPVQHKAWILKPLEYILQLTDNAPSYSTIEYLTHYLSYWEGIFRNTVPSQGELLHSLIELNYNEPSFIRFFISYLHQQMDEGVTLYGRVAHLSEQLLVCNRICTQSKLAWHPSLPPAKEVIVSIIEKELGILMSQLPYVKEIEARTVTNSFSGQPLAITSLSVSQLAVLVRLLNECSLIKCDNQSAFFKGLVAAVRTEKTKKLSAESLRCKYYAPERPAIAIVRDYLFRMINQLKDM